MSQSAARRPIHSAVLLAIGSELTTGQTRDTNSGDIASWLAEAGVEVLWITALPDSLPTVSEALTGALTAADLIVTTGGLGPTPDDLTRESVAHVMGEAPVVDPGLERWLRQLFGRRGTAFAEINIKQAWLIPSATAIPNERGTAPGWWVDTADGRIVVALPGPPREMSSMWRDSVMPRLRDRGIGREIVVRTYRTAGIGESLVAAQLGEPVLRAANPVVATYARADGVDVRITAVAAEGRSATEWATEAETAVLAAVGANVWGHDDDTWPDVLGRLLAERGWTAALVEVGTGGAGVRLLGEASWLREARVIAEPRADPAADVPLHELAQHARDESGASLGIAVSAVESGGDTRVELVVVGPWGTSRSRQLVFLGGSEGRRRAALALAAFLHDLLKSH